MLPRAAVLLVPVPMLEAMAAADAPPPPPRLAPDGGSLITSVFSSLQQFTCVHAELLLEDST